MTSNQAKLQALIDMLDSAFDESRPDAIAQQQAIAQIRQQLLELQRDGETSQEASARQVLQAVVQEMGYLRSNMIQPLREEITQLHSQRRLLAADVKQLQQRQQEIKASQQQAMLQEFMQSLMARLQDQMTTQVVQAITLMQPQISGEAEGGALSSAQQVEQLRRLQATSNELMLKMDSTLRVVFDSLQTTVDDYRESLGQGLEKMHGLGQQGETLFAALVNRLASQLGREASQYLNQSMAADLPRTAESHVGTVEGDVPLSSSRDTAGLMEENPFSDTASDEARFEQGPSIEDANALSTEQIDQLLQQNLLQTPEEPGDTVDDTSTPSLSDIDSNALIDEIEALEQDIDAISDEIIFDELNLDLGAVDLPAASEVAGETSTAPEDEAIALFQLGEDGVTIDESADPASGGSGPAGASEELETPPDEDAPLSEQGEEPFSESPSESDEIAAFYDEFNAATTMAADAPADLEAEASNPDIDTFGFASELGDGDDPESGDSTAAMAAQTEAGAEPSSDSDTPPDRVQRLSDLIDPDVLQQLGSAGASGVGSPYAMASLGEDLLPTTEDGTVLPTDLDLDLDQLAADLARIEPDGSGEDDTVTGFLTPDDDFFAVEPVQEPAVLPPPVTEESEGLPDDSDAASRPTGVNPESPTQDTPAGSAETSQPARPRIDLPFFAPPAAPDVAPEDLSAAEPERTGDRRDGDPGEVIAEENSPPIEGDGLGSEDPTPEISPPSDAVAAASVEDDDVIDEAAIDEIAALFAALERTEHDPTERSTIAQQTLADLLKPAADPSTTGSQMGTPAPDTGEAGTDDEKKK